MDASNLANVDCKESLLIVSFLFGSIKCYEYQIVKKKNVIFSMFTNKVLALWFIGLSTHGDGLPWGLLGFLVFICLFFRDRGRERKKDGEGQGERERRA